MIFPTDVPGPEDQLFDAHDLHCSVLCFIFAKLSQLSYSLDFCTLTTLEYYVDHIQHKVLAVGSQSLQHGAGHNHWAAQPHTVGRICDLGELTL